MTMFYILFSGKQGSGKTTLANRTSIALTERGVRCLRTRFAESLYELHNQLRDSARELGIPVPQKDGKLLQLLGTEWGRHQYGDGVWVNSLLQRVRKVESLYDVVIIDDCRFPNELALAVGDKLTVRLECPSHIRQNRTDGWRNTDTHESEIALDSSLDKFDLTINTELVSIDEALNAVLSKIPATLYSYNLLDHLR